MKRSLALILIILFIFLSCGTKTENDKELHTASLLIETNSPETEIKDSLPYGLDFDGETINISVRGDNNTMIEFFAEESGDIVEDAVYRRNSVVEERLNIKINVIEGKPWEQYDQTVTAIRASINAGDNMFDLIAGWSARIPILAAEGLFMNLHELPYLKATEPWWNKSIVSELTIGDKLNFIAGDINLTCLERCVIIYENNKIREDYNLPNIYDTVFDGKWTLEYLNNLVKNIHHDLNGDGVMNENDFYGALWDTVNQADAFLQSSNIRMIKKDSDNIPYFEIEYEKLSALVDRIYDFFFNNEGVYAADYSAKNGDYTAMFKNNQGYLTSGYLGHASEVYRDFETEYSIIPFPKYDDLQEKYLTRVQDGLSLLCVPLDCTKLEAVGAFMEAAACESYKNVTPVYFDIAMKVKYARDEISTKMLDIIRDGINLPFASIYNESIGSPWFVMRSLMTAKSNNFASWYETNRPRIETAIEKLVEQMLEAG